MPDPGTEEGAWCKAGMADSCNVAMQHKLSAGTVDGHALFEPRPTEAADLHVDEQNFSGLAQGLTTVTVRLA